MNLADIKQPLFGTRPVFQLFCGERASGPLCDTLIPDRLVPTIDDEDILAEHVHLAGLYPILALGFEPTFIKEVDASLLPDTLALMHLKRSSHRFGAMRRVDALDIIHRCLTHLKGRNLETYRLRNSLTIYIYASVLSGERLVTLTVGMVPVPGYPGAMA